jgi:LacI family transcriptional regulator
MPTLDQSPKSLTPPKKPTLGMVAELAGVSPSTVSRILNGTAKVSPNKMAAVSEAIDMLQFRPDPAARSLAGGRTMSVGVLTQFIDSPYYGEALRGMEDVLRQHQYVPLFTSGHWNEVEERERLTLLQERKVDGIIVLTGRVSDQTLLDIAQDLPIVVIGRKLQGPQVFSIDIDNFEGSRMATRHLISLGHRSIGYVSGPMDHKDAIERLEGYKRELQEKQLPFDPALVVEGDFQESGGFRAMSRLLHKAGAEQCGLSGAGRHLPGRL